MKAAYNAVLAVVGDSTSDRSHKKTPTRCCEDSLARRSNLPQAACSTAASALAIQPHAFGGRESFETSLALRNRNGHYHRGCVQGYVALRHAFVPTDFCMPRMGCWGLVDPDGAVDTELVFAHGQSLLAGVFCPKLAAPLSYPLQRGLFHLPHHLTILSCTARKFILC